MGAWKAFFIGVFLMLFIWFLTKIPLPDYNDPAQFIRDYWEYLVTYAPDAARQMLQDVANTGGSLRNYLYNLFGLWPQP